MKLEEYLDGMRAARNDTDLEAAIHAPFKHGFRGPTWSRICKVRIEVGRRIVAADPAGRYVPIFGEGRRLTVCGESYKVGRGGNSTGVRYCWAYAQEFAEDALVRNGLSKTAANRIWDGHGSYPHRALQVVRDALAGKIPDPPLNRLIFSHNGGPIKYSVRTNNADKYDRRASRPCRCGGTRFDWGCGWTGAFNFINWHCNKCPRVYCEYVTTDRLSEIRNPKHIVPVRTSANG